MREHTTEYVVQYRYRGGPHPDDYWRDYDVSSRFEDANDVRINAERLPHRLRIGNPEYRIVQRETTETVVS